jgi:hypothetical protein
VGISNVLANLAGNPGALSALIRDKLYRDGQRQRRRLAAAPPQVDVKRFRDDGEPLAEATLAAFDTALKADASALLPRGLVQMPGMSGRRYRVFINELMRRISDPRYLEVGSWGGSTLCSALHANKIKAVAIDNWSQFDGPAAQFFKNLGVFIGKSQVSVLTSDFRAVAYEAIGKFNVYLFDGPHAYEDHHDGLALPAPALDDRFVFIVDDWNWDDVRDGTWKAIRALGLDPLLTIDLRSAAGNAHASDMGLPVDQDSDWHNGYFIAVLSRG